MSYPIEYKCTVKLYLSHDVIEPLFYPPPQTVSLWFNLGTVAKTFEEYLIKHYSEILKNDYDLKFNYEYAIPFIIPVSCMAKSMWQKLPVEKKETVLWKVNDLLKYEAVRFIDQWLQDYAINGG